MFVFSPILKSQSQSKSLPLATYLELVLVTAQRRALLLPEVVWLDDIGNVDGAGKVFLQYLQDRLHGAPSGTSHVDDHREPLFPHFITGTRTANQLQSVNCCKFTRTLKVRNEEKI
jgi:uncharacterized protein (DUF608 family)